MGRLSPAMSPPEARMGAVLMAMLAGLAIAVAGAVYSSTGALGMPALFLVLAAVGASQVAYYHRMGKQ